MLLHQRRPGAVPAAAASDSDDVAEVRPLSPDDDDTAVAIPSAPALHAAAVRRRRWSNHGRPSSARPWRPTTPREAGGGGDDGGSDAGSDTPFIPASINNNATSRKNDNSDGVMYGGDDTGLAVTVL